MPIVEFFDTGLQSDCATFEQGVMTRGLHSAFLVLQKHLRAALSLVTQVRRCAPLNLLKACKWVQN